MGLVSSGAAQPCPLWASCFAPGCPGRVVSKDKSGSWVAAAPKQRTCGAAHPASILFYRGPMAGPGLTKRRFFT